MADKPMLDKHWLWVDSFRYRQPVEEKFGTATVVSSVSPYSVPDAVAAYTDKKTGLYFLEAKYIGPEEPTEVLRWGDSKIVRGKNSKRFFLIAVHLPNSAQRSQIFDVMKKCITSFGASEKKALDNYAILNAVIDENKSRLPIEEVS